MATRVHVQQTRVVNLRDNGFFAGMFEPYFLSNAKFAALLLCHASKLRANTKAASRVTCITVLTFVVRFLILALLCCFAFSASAQNPLSGIINIYTPVTAIACNKVTVDNASGFIPGSGVLVIQMKGATVDQSNTSTSGDVLTYNQVGNYEFGWVTSTSGNDIFLLNPLLQPYDVTQKVQLVKVPSHNFATVVGTVLPQPWNGTTGGVVALICTGTLTMNADIDASDAGFKGGNVAFGPFACFDSSFVYPIGNAGFKGESISEMVVGMETGRGKWAGGGGGGNAGNNGGGGGGLGGNGGLGGYEWSGCGFTGIQGIGGQQLTYNALKVFPGSGGGAGYGDNGLSVTNGTNGGGIVIIRANAIAGNGHFIKANGKDQLMQSMDESAGGGGSGGSVYLEVNDYLSTTNVQANGGKGGNIYNVRFDTSSHGPGGGGSGGIIALSQSALPANVTVEAVGGMPGLSMHPWPNPYYNQPFGAQQGDSGLVEFELMLPESFLSLPEISLGNDTTVCTDGSFLINGPTGFASYVWQDGSTQQSIPVFSAGAYSVSVTTSGGCVVYDSVFISAPAWTLIDVLSDTSLCIEDSVTWFAPSGLLSYDWNTGETTSAITIHQPGLYSVTLSDNDGCVKTDSAFVEQYLSPNIELGNDVSGCEGATTIISAPNGFATYHWNTGENSSQINVSASGVYSVAITDDNGCSAYDSVTYTTTQISMDTIADQTICWPDPTTVVAPPGFAQYVWSNGLVGSNVAFSEIGNYSVTVTDENGCTASDAFDIEFDCPPWADFANAFTPNGDGLNDEFNIRGDHISNYELKIFDRWGYLVFSSESPNDGWSGYGRNGKQCEIGVYAYIAFYTLGDGANQTRHQRAGNVTLVR